MNERIKKLRKALGLTLKKFGEKVGISEGAVSNIEKGKRNVTNQMIKSICREFNVDYIWLTTGEGEMFHPVEESVNDIIERIMTGENKMHINLIKWVATLDDEDIKHLEIMINKYLDIAKEKNNE